MLNGEMIIMCTKKIENSSKEETESALLQTEQKEYEYYLREWGKFRKEVLKDFLKVHNLLQSHCHISMREKLSTNKNIKETVKKPDACVLWKETKKISNASSTDRHSIMKMFIALYELVCIRGDSYNNSADFFAAFQQNWELAEKAGFVIATPQLQNCYLEELEDDNQHNNMYNLLSNWKQSEVSKQIFDKDKHKSRKKKTTVPIFWKHFVQSVI